MRQKALEILNDIEVNNRFSHEAIAAFLKETPDLSDVDRRFLMKLVRGVLENKIYLDYVIRKYSKQRFTRIDPRIVTVLRMGFYQLLFMDKVPESAAVNESVKLAKGVQKSQGDFVNGVLRAYLRSGEKMPLPDKRHMATYLSVKYSHPEWMTKFFLDQYGKAFTESLLEANNAVPPLTIRVNTTKISVEDYKVLLEKEGISVEKTSLCTSVLKIPHLSEQSLTSLVGFEEGYFQIQDLASAMVGEIAEVTLGAAAIDVCAAPGGKATHIAQKLNQTGCVIARDLTAGKLEKITENIARLGLKNMKVELFDALEISEALVGTMDLVMVDAPCSGLGIIRRKPDIKYNKTPEDLTALKEIQQKILNNASNYVKINGELIYSTCTLNREENEQVVEAFLAEHPNFSRKAFKVGEEVVDTAMYTFYPHVHGTDGFFIAKLTRNDER